MLYLIIDFILRVFLMGFFVVFLYQCILNYRKTKSLKEPKAARYFLAYIIFYLFSLINFLIMEIDVQYGNLYEQSIFPIIGYTIQFGGTTFQIKIQTLVLIAILIPSLIPILNLIEKEILKTKVQIITITGIIITGLILLVIFLPPIITFAFIPVFLGVLILPFSIVLIYLKLTLSSDGIVRKSALLLFFGWLLVFLGFILISVLRSLIGIMIDPILSAIIEHSIALIGVIFIYYGAHLARR